MEILPLGHSSFRLRGKNATVVTDPFDGKDMAVKFPKHIEADVVTISHDHPDHNAITMRVRAPSGEETRSIGLISITS